MFIYSACNNSILCQSQTTSCTGGGGLPISSEPVSFVIDGNVVSSSTTLGDRTVITLATKHPIYALTVQNGWATSNHYIGIRTSADAVLLIVNAFMDGAVVEVPGMDLASVPTVSSGASAVFPLQISTEFVYSSSEIACTSSDHSDCIRVIPTNAGYKRFGMQIMAIPINLP